MDKNKKYLSASRIKVIQSCSWKYYCKYVLKLPEASNDGARRGSVCHLIFEVLGNPRHRRHFNSIIRSQDVFNSETIKKLVYKTSRKLGVDDDENINLIKEYILNGLNLDFFGLALGKPTQVLSEHDFRIEKDEYPIRYNVLGFIDKLFLYKKKSKAIIRDFKTSKKMFEGGEIDDNLQDWIYSLAVKDGFPEYKDRQSEFIFLKFLTNSDVGHMAMEPIEDHSLEAFEYELSHYQQIVENFDYKTATGNYAADQPFPSDGTFGGKLNCGFAKKKGQIKKDGTPMWHCPFKFDFEYYSIMNSNGEIVKNYSEEEFNESLVPEGHIFVKTQYDGCPRHNKA
jgi:hypothetical protein